MKLLFRTFSKQNECEKQEGISPDSIKYCGKISDIEDSTMTLLGIGYMGFYDAIKDAKLDEDSVIIFSVK